MLKQLQAVASANDMTELTFIDAHHHLWDLSVCRYPWLMARGEKRFFGDPSPIQKNYLSDDFLSESARFIPSKSVHIQVGVAEQDSVKESQWLEQHSDFPHAVVAFTDLSAVDLAQQLDRQQAFSKLRGIRQIIGRHLTEDVRHGTNELLDNPDWLSGLKLLAARGLSFDLQMIPPQMPAVLALLKQVPDLKVALCHCGSPWDQTIEGLASWKNGLQQLAELANVSCKVSGLGMFNPHWDTEQLRPIIEDVLDIFGCNRVMFGSNFPVDKLYRSYDNYWQAYSDITEGCSIHEKQQMFNQTATDFYCL